MTYGFPVTPRPPTKSNPGRVVMVSAVVVLALTVVVALLVWVVHPGTVDGHAVKQTRSGDDVVVDSDGLESLLVSPTAVSQILGVPDMVTVATWMKPDSSDEAYEPRDCLGALYSGMAVMYANNGYSAIFQTRIAPDRHDEDAIPSADQSVSSFDSADDAQSALNDYLGTIQRCAGKDLTFPEKRVTFKLGNPEDAGDGITTMDSAMTTGARIVDRALTVKGNVLVEVQIEDTQPRKGELLTITHRLLDNIGG